MRGPPGRRRLRILLATACSLAALAAAVVLLTSSSARPQPFYEPPTPLPRGPHGTLIRAEQIPDYYPGAKAYRVLYKSHGPDGRVDAVSGLVIVPDGPTPRGGRKVVDFTHGGVGIARGCAPSLHAGDPGQVIEGLGEFIAAGYVVAATDYAGLGVPGAVPELVGPLEAMNALDIVRAARRLRVAHAGTQFVVWGHSQGGQAALFTGQLAASYTPELHLLGVAAGSPLPDLRSLFRLDLVNPAGSELTASALSAWSQLYPDARLEQILTPTGRAALADLADRCLYGREYSSGAPTLEASEIVRAPWDTEPWRRIMEENTPGPAPIGAPILLVQGSADPVVPSRLTVRLAALLCSAGEEVELRLYPSVEHVEAGIVASPDVVAWMAGRFAGRPAPSSCRHRQAAAQAG